MIQCNTEIYRVILRIQSEYGKLRTRKNSIFEHFSRSVSYRIPIITQRSQKWYFMYLIGFLKRYFFSMDTNWTVWFVWNLVSFKHKFLTFEYLSDVRLLSKLCRIDFYIVLKLILFTLKRIDFRNVVKTYLIKCKHSMILLIKKLKVWLRLLLQFYFTFRYIRHKRKGKISDTII